MAEEYEEWQNLLSTVFLPQREGPAVFFIDDDELARHYSKGKDAAVDLAQAVSSRLRIANGRSMFAFVVRDFEDWKRGSRLHAPPVLPVIALTVLAATRMRSDAEARSTNYYLRLAQVLAPEADAEAVESLRRHLRDGDAFLDVVEMWRGLHAWIEDQNGVVGTSTIRDHTHLQRIGYPLSQALVRQSDRMILTRFFQALEFTSSAVPSPSVVLEALDIWTTASHNRLSDAFMHALGDSDLRLLLANVVQAHAQAWDGQVLTSEGRQLVAMRLSIDLDSWQVRWLFPIPLGGPEMLNIRAPGSNREIRLVDDGGLDYYTVQNAPGVNADLLLSGIRFLGDEFSAEFLPAPVLFLCADPETGAWSSVQSMIPFEEHLVAVSSALVTEFKLALSEAAAEGWQIIMQRKSVLLPGYALFRNVRFTNGQALARALSRLPGIRHVGVTPAVPRARLTYGLPIALSMSGTHYLVGGEPDLLLPSATDPRTVLVTLDGRRQQLQANGFPLELRHFVSDVGRHVVNADGQELSFTTLEEGPDAGQPLGTATIGWTEDGRIADQSQEFAVVGARATLTEEMAPVLVRRRRDESWLLHHDGRIEELAEPALPSFLSTADVELHLPRWELSAPASARWLAQRRGPRWRVTEVGPSDPREYNLDIDVLDVWKKVCRDETAARLWAIQLRIAEGVS